MLFSNKKPRFGGAFPLAATYSTSSGVPCKGVIAGNQPLQSIKSKLGPYRRSHR